MLKALILGAFLSLGSPASAQAEIDNKCDQSSYGVVSWYGGKYHGRKTTSGETFNKNALTCAAIDRYKLGEKLQVTNVDNGKSVIVTVNDRGPFGKKGRTLDLSEAAFKQIASTKKGLLKVEIKRL